jgi:hypothetical protein
MFSSTCLCTEIDRCNVHHIPVNKGVSTKLKVVPILESASKQWTKLSLHNFLIGCYLLSLLGNGPLFRSGPRVAKEALGSSSKQDGLFELTSLRALPKTARSCSVQEINQYKQTRSLDSLPARILTRRKAPSQMEVFGRVVSLAVLLFQFERSAP